MKNILRILSQDYEIIRKHLSKDEREQFLFLLCEHYDEGFYIVREILLPDDEEIKEQHRAYVEPGKYFQLTAYEIAAEKGYSIIDCHTHPFQTKEPSFSNTDKDSGKENGIFIAGSIPEINFGLIVFNRGINAYSGVIFQKSKQEFNSLDSIEILGSPTTIMFNNEEPKKQVEDEKYSRHNLIPNWKQHMLPDLKVAVIGAGGIGSEIIQKLVCLGVGELILIDDDVVEESNLPRIPYANPDNIGKPKVEVAASYAKFRNPDINITAISKKVQDNEVREFLQQAHIIFGCVDTEGGRKILTRFSVEYCIPYIDVASEIILEQEGYHAGGQVRITLPRQGCLICYGGIDLSEAAQDLVTDEVAKDYEKAGYVRGTNFTPTPSVLHLNSTVSSIAVSQLIKLLFGENLEGQKAVFYDQQKMSLIAADFDRNEDCPMCCEKPRKAREIIKEQLRKHSLQSSGEAKDVR